MLSAQEVPAVGLSLWASLLCGRQSPSQNSQADTSVRMQASLRCLRLPNTRTVTPILHPEILPVRLAAGSPANAVSGGHVIP